MSSKVVLKLGDAELEIEGDNEFIAKQMEEFYKFASSNPSQARPASEEARPQKEAPQDEPPIKKRTGRKRPAGPSCASRIEELKKDDNFFSSPRSSSDISDKLSERATPYEGKHIAAALISLTQRGSLRRVKGEEGKWLYVNP